MCTFMHAYVNLVSVVQDNSLTHTQRRQKVTMQLFLANFIKFYKLCHLRNAPDDTWVKTLHHPVVSQLTAVYRTLTLIM